MKKVQKVDYDPIAAAIEDFALNDGGSAAKEALAMGIPIYYVEQDTPPGLLIKKYPDGRRELVEFSRKGDKVIRKL